MQRTRFRPDALTYRSERLARVGLVALLVALAIAAFEARATVVVMRSLERMTEKSDVVVHARVTDQVVKWEGERIVTLTELEVLDGIKGAKYGDVLTLSQLGGSIDGVTARVAGTSEFHLGEEIILFGVRFEGRVLTYGVGVGKFQIQYDAEGALVDPPVVEELFDVVTPRKDANGEVVFESPEPRSAPRLSEFKATLRGYVEKLSQPRALKLNAVKRPALRALEPMGDR